MTVVDQKNFATGILYCLISVVVVIVSLNYSIGTARAMGPGFFPLGVGIALFFTGIVLLGRALLPGGSRSRLGPFRLNAVVCILASVVAFTVLIEPMGMIAATVALIGISAFASKKPRWPLIFASMAVLVPLCWLIFVALLGLQFRLLPPFLGVRW